MEKIKKLIKGNSVVIEFPFTLVMWGGVGGVTVHG